MRSDPERFKKSAAEEVIRHRPGFYAAGKKATRAHAAYGLEFEEGEPISIMIGGPNRDSSRWTDPDRFDITRDARVWSLTFSMGNHFCLGQALARAEVQEALSVFVTECDEIEITEEPIWLSHVMVNRLESVPIRYSPRPDNRPGNKVTSRCSKESEILKRSCFAGGKRGPLDNVWRIPCAKRRKLV